MEMHPEGDTAGVVDVNTWRLLTCPYACAAGVFIQGCMFRLNGIPGADFACRG